MYKIIKVLETLISWTVQSQCSNVEATASTRAVAPHTKLYIPSIISHSSSQQRLYQKFYVLTLCCKCLRSLDFLQCKMSMFQRVGMREGGMPLPLAFQYLIFMV